jgi:hypothetical protein
MLRVFGIGQNFFQVFIAPRAAAVSGRASTFAGYTAGTYYFFISYFF